MANSEGSKTAGANGDLANGHVHNIRKRRWDSTTAAAFLNSVHSFKVCSICRGHAHCIFGDLEDLGDGRWLIKIAGHGISLTADQLLLGPTSRVFRRKVREIAHIDLPRLSPDDWCLLLSNRVARHRARRVRPASTEN